MSSLIVHRLILYILTFTDFIVHKNVKCLPLVLYQTANQTARCGVTYETCEGLACLSALLFYRGWCNAVVMLSRPGAPLCPVGVWLSDMMKVQLCKSTE